MGQEALPNYEIISAMAEDACGPHGFRSALISI